MQQKENEVGWSLLNYSTLSYWLQQKENGVDLYQITSTLSYWLQQKENEVDLY